MDSQIRSLVRRFVAEMLELQEEAVSDEMRFRDLGLCSAQAVTLLSRLSEHLGRTLPVAAVWEHPSVAALAAYLSSSIESAGEAVRPSSAASSVLRTDEPVAIVGMGCRFPDGIHSPSTLWEALEKGLDAVREVPVERWDLNRWYDKDPRAPGKMNTRWGGFIDDVSGFDAGFFRISPKEAAQMDPQQRLALEVVWEALEDAGIVPETLAGSSTGVFVGAWSQDYADLGALDARSIEQHSATGWNNSIIPARIAYSLGLRGPVLTVNTACSSSLVAVHLAIQSLRSGESELALVSGVNLLLAPNTTVQMTRFGGMSPTGRCRTFDADADGYVRGEGCGAVVLRRLSDALRAGERIYAVIRGSAMNNDGASNGLTAPNPEAQREVFQAAWHRAGVPPHEVSYVETHGTGTPLGDPIEASALGDVMGKGRSEPLRIGSIKTNLGHLEGAAGIAGLIKTALALHYGALPPNLHFNRPNPLIPFDQLRLQVLRERESWPGESERHAGVSSFGYGGTNAHVALSEPSHHRRALLPLAAETEADLERLAEGWCARLEDVQGDRALHALMSPSGHGPVRAVVKGRHPKTLQAALTALAGGETSSSSRVRNRPRIVFVFSGHGSQWLGMGRDLFATEPTFNRVLRACDRFIEAEAGWSVISELCATENSSRLDRTDVIQPALYAIQVALARTLQSWSIQPCAVLGQSIGEVAAAVIGGALSEEAGSRLIIRWSSLVPRTVSGRGTMLVASLGQDQAEAWLRNAGVLGIDARNLSVSGYLAPQSVSFAGTAEAIRVLQNAMQADGVRVHPVAIDYAGHSPLMQGITPALLEQLSDLVPGELQIPMWSTVHGRFVEGTELHGAYWAQNLLLPTGLQRGIEALAREATHFIDIGPHPITLRSIAATLEGSTSHPAMALGTCWRAESAWRGLEDLASTLWCAGAALDWKAFAGHGSSHAPASTSVPLLLSAHSEAALRAQAGRWASWLKTQPELRWPDVVRTAALHRTHFEYRASIMAESAREAVDALTSLNQARPHRCAVEGTARSRRKPVFVFPGQGSQWLHMGRAMLRESTVFADAAQACDAALRPYTGWSVLAVLRGDEDGTALSPDRVDVVQPALFTMSLALAAVWRSLGVEPAAVIGHSQGEVTAAVVSGALSLEDGARVMALRSKLLLRLAGAGAMAMVELPLEVVEEKLKDARWSDLHVAVVNTATSAAVAGRPERIDAWVDAITEEGAFCRRIAVDYASHTPHVDRVVSATVHNK